MSEDMIYPAMWAVTAVIGAMFVARALWYKRRGLDPGRWKIGVAGAALAAVLVVPSIGVVPAGHRGVVYEYSGGVSADERGEGVTLLVPWAQRMRSFSVRTQKVIVDKLYAQSKDLQEITVPVSVNYHVKPDRAAELYQGVGEDYADTVIKPALLQRAKAAIGQVLAEDFAQRRESLAETIQRRLTDQLSGYGIAIEYVNVEDAIFDKQFIAAVKAKIIAEQKAEEERRLIAAEAAIKEQTIIKAEAEARSILITASAKAAANERITSSVTPEILRWQWLETWDGSLPTTLANGDAGLLIGVYP